jgi:predicted anti-sigma-YlaC factor YlaD
MSTDGCAETRLALGAYVLGALEPAERSRVDAHLSTCVECREELASLAGMPGLLGRLSRDDFEAEPVKPGPELLDRLLAAAAAERGRERKRGWALSAAAAVIVVAAVSVAVVASQADNDKTVAATKPPVGVSETFAATNADNHVQATVVESKKGWGAALQVTVTGVTAELAGPSCQLIAVGKDGKTEVAASWAAPAEGYSGTSKVNANGATSLPSADITAFKVVGSDGATLVWVPAVWST